MSAPGPAHAHLRRQASAAVPTATSVSDMPFRAVLFDWRGTLVTSPGPVWAVEQALTRIDRPAAPSDVDAVLSAVLEANGDANRLDTPGMDTDALLHREIAMAVFRDAGLDTALGESLYPVDTDVAYNVFATDVRSTLEVLRERQIAVAVVSDIHFDIRPHFAAAGCARLVDVFTLSFEHGVQKPDPRIFTTTLTALGVTAEEALMVGDRSGPDGGAVECGIATLLLPPLSSADDERLHLALALCDR